MHVGTAGYLQKRRYPLNRRQNDHLRMKTDYFGVLAFGCICRHTHLHNHICIHMCMYLRPRANNWISAIQFAHNDGLPTTTASVLWRSDDFGWVTTVRSSAISLSGCSYPDQVLDISAYIPANDWETVAMNKTRVASNNHPKIHSPQEVNLMENIFIVDDDVFRTSS